MERAFPNNPVLRSMAYSNGELSVVFIKRAGNKTSLQERHYAEVPKEIAYSWFYKNTASECLQYYAQNIRKKFRLLKITQAL